jgi:hypothetical protein
VFCCTLCQVGALADHLAAGAHGWEDAAAGVAAPRRLPGLAGRLPLGGLRRRWRRPACKCRHAEEPCCGGGGGGSAGGAGPGCGGSGCASVHIPGAPPRLQVRRGCYYSMHLIDCSSHRLLTGVEQSIVECLAAQPVQPACMSPSVWVMHCGRHGVRLWVLHDPPHWRARSPKCIVSPKCIRCQPEMHSIYKACLLVLRLLLTGCMQALRNSPATVLKPG